MSSPSLDAVRRCWQRVLAGGNNDTDLLHALQAYEDSLSEELERLGEGDSDAHRSLERCLAAVDRMLMELDQPDQGHMDAGLQLADQAEAARSAAAAVGGAVLCPFCGQPRETGTSRCGACQRPLPFLEGATSSLSVMQNDGLDRQSRRQTQNAAALTRVLAQFRAGEATWDDLLAQIDDVEDKLIGHQEANAQSTTQTAEQTERVNLLLEESLSAVDCMRLAWDKNDESYLDNGLASFAQSSEALLQLLDDIKASR